ncbi:MAG: VCBS repeat-containing protein [Bacteroidetes bacterium]|nr:VCBS repeat-containing protein [Bacteroidota bacterium]
MKKSFFICFILALSLNSMSQTFTKITTGPVVSTPGDSRSVNWIDMNNDGLIDLFISNGRAGGQNNMLYMNLGNGSFLARTGDPIVSG